MTTVGAFLGGLGVGFDKAASWDPAPLQLGDPGAAVNTVGVCHEVTEAVVATVESNPVDLLVTYHPLLFKPTTRLTAGRSPAGRAYRLIRAGVALATIHTAFDAAPGGTADALAGALGLGDLRGFAPLAPAGQAKVVTFVPAAAVEAVASAMARAGAGVIGNYTGCSYRSEGMGTFLAQEGAAPVIGAVGAPSVEPETRLEMICPASKVDDVVAALAAAHPYEEPAFDVYDVRSNLGFLGRVGALADAAPFDRFVEHCGEVLGTTGLRASGSAEVATVAVLPGSGGSFVKAAASAGADVFVTGDVFHHTMVEAADGGLAVIDPGHAPSERPGVAALRDRLAASGTEVVDLTDLDPTPWR